MFKIFARVRIVLSAGSPAIYPHVDDVYSLPHQFDCIVETYSDFLSNLLDNK